MYNNSKTSKNKLVFSEGSINNQDEALMASNLLMLKYDSMVEFKTEEFSIRFYYSLNGISIQTESQLRYVINSFGFDGKEGNIDVNEKYN